MAYMLASTFFFKLVGYANLNMASVHTTIKALYATSNPPAAYSARGYCMPPVPVFPRTPAGEQELVCP